MNEIKVCSICGLEKPITEYNKCGKNSYRSMCKKCYNKQKSDRRKNDIEHVKKLERQRYKKNATKERQRRKDYRENNKESIDEYRTELYNSIKPGVYKIINLLTNETLWVGESEKPYQRGIEHFSNTSNHRSPIAEQIYLGNLNRNDVDMIMIEFIDDKKKRFERETFWIKELKPIYNNRKK